jgi:hypothetical protein
MIEIVEVKNQHDLKRFIAFPTSCIAAIRMGAAVTADELNTLRSDKNRRALLAGPLLLAITAASAGRIAAYQRPRSPRGVIKKRVSVDRFHR